MPQITHIAMKRRSPRRVISKHLTGSGYRTGRWSGG
jgi:hypothetical protein